MGNKCRLEVRTISLLYFKQAMTTKQPTSIDTMTMQSMWCNANINTCFSNTTGLQQGWEKTHAVRIWEWMQVRTISQLHFLSRQLQLSNLPVYELCQIETMQAMWCKGEESSTLVCPIRLVCLNDRQLDANNPPVSAYTLTTQPRWSNQIITICLSNTMGLHQVLEDSHALRMWGFMQVRSI